MIRSLVLIVILFLFGCQEEILLESDDNDKILVVEGMITNEPGPYTVNLSMSTYLYQPEVIPVSGSKVTIQCDDGYSEILIETEPGIYMTSETGIQGEIGKQYKIHILTNEGKEYESSFQEMKEAVVIESVYAELEYKEHLDYVDGLPGYQFYVNTEPSSVSDNYFLWKMEETYEYTAYYLDLIMFGEFYPTSKPDTLVPYFRQFFRCWKKENVNYVYTAKTSGLNNSFVRHQPLHFVSTDSKRLTYRYSLLLTQFTIQKEAYAFWKSIENQSTAENFLFAGQVFNIFGNVININITEEPVFGYFTVASVDTKRIFVDRPFVPFYFSDCFIGEDIESLLSSPNPPPPPYYIATSFYGITGNVGRKCVICETEGGSIIKPDFWIE